MEAKEKPYRYRLGIDLGTASLSVVAMELDAQDPPQPIRPIWHAVRIFQEPLEKNSQGNLRSKKAKCGEARRQRRQTERRANRPRHIAHLAPLIGLDAKKIRPHSGNGFSALRARAAREAITLPELLNVILRLAKKRGYKGDFKVKADKDAGIVKTGADALAQAMKKLAEARSLPFVTLGEYLHYRISEQKLPGKLTIDRQDVDNLYALRCMVEQEFEQIWATQSKYHAMLNSTHAGEPIKDHFHRAIFFQRPLKSPAFMVGHCQLEPQLPRAPMAQPAAQNFRIEKTLHDLRWGAGRKAEPLTVKQRDALRELLQDPGKLTKDGTINFKKIHKHLQKRGCPGTDGTTFNLERESRKGLIGNRTLVCFKALDLLASWEALDALTQVQTINFLADLGSPEQLGDDEWGGKYPLRQKAEKAQIQRTIQAIY